MLNCISEVFPDSSSVEERIILGSFLLCLLLIVFLLIEYGKNRNIKKSFEEQNRITDSILRNIQSYVMLVSSDSYVIKTNYYMLTGEEQQDERKRIGEILECAFAVESGGCFKNSACTLCEVRQNIRKTFDTGQGFSRLETSMKLRLSSREVTVCDVMISGSYVKINNREMVLVTVHDISEQKRAKKRADENEEKFYTVFGNLPVGVALCDPQGIFKEVNNAYMESMGIVSKADVIGRFNIFTNPCLSDEIKQRMRRGEYISEEVKYDYEVLGREGYLQSLHLTPRYFRFIVNYLTDRQGNISSLIIIWVDNTLIHHTLKQNKKYQDMFSFASSVSHIGFSSADLLKGEDIVTPEYLRNLGENRDASLQAVRSRYDRVHPDDRETLIRFISQAAKEKIEPINLDIRVRTDGDRWRWVKQYLIQRIFEPEKDNIVVLGINIDIDTQKKIEEELNVAKNRAEESDKLKSAFLANMSHEIRTPLNAITGFSELLAETPDEAERASYVEIIKNNNGLLLQLIDDILDLSKIDANTLEFTYTDTDITLLFREIEQLFRMKMQGSPVQLICEPALSRCIVHTEKNRLSQVLTNFITNAIKFTEKGSIRFGYELREKDLYFYVADTGCGISETDREAIFGRFIKLDKFKQGTGLGLAICEKIVTKMGGRIGVKSRTGEGSEFWFTLPCSLIKPDTEEKDKNIRQKDFSSQPSAKTEKTDTRPTLLIAEDVIDNYRLYESILCKKYNLLHAWNGEEAVRLFTKHAPDAVLMDIKMPEMDGYEATRQIRLRSADVPVVAVTAFAFNEDKEKILKSGFDSYLTKPISLSALFKTLEEIGV